MKAVLQRVSRAEVVVHGASVGKIDAGLLVLLCAERGDANTQADKLLAKILKLRIFSDGPAARALQARPGPGGAVHEVASVRANRLGKMNLSVVDIQGGLLVVSQFTLAADVSAGNRPSFTGAAAPDEGLRLYDYFVARARSLHPRVETGEFGADMQVHLVNDGPVTISLRIDPAC